MQNISTYTPAMAFSVPGVERQRLVSMLVQCSCIADPDTRDLVIGDLPQDIQSVMRHNQKLIMSEIRHLVDACLLFDDGLNTLIQTMQSFEPENSTPLKAAATFVKQLHSSHTRIKLDRHIQALQPILARLSEPDLTTLDLERLYSLSIPENIASRWNYPPQSSQIDMLFTMRDKLIEALPAPGEIPALLKFIERIAISLQTPLRLKRIGKELQGWTNDHAQAWDINAQQIASLRTELELEQAAEKKLAATSPHVQPPHLLIMLKLAKKHKTEKDVTEQCNQARFSVDAWLHYGHNEVDSLHFSRKEELYTSDSIAKLLADLLTQVSHNTKLSKEMKARVVFDFFLPRHLFSCPIEHWKISGNQTIGMRNPVVIRAADRLKDKINWPLWEMKWEKAHQSQAIADPVHWIEHVDKIAGVYGKLIKEDVVGLGLTLVPPAIVDPSDPEELFFNIIISGTPIAFWPRHLPSIPEKLQVSQDKIKTLLANCSLLQLPEQILEQRRDAGGDRDHLGYSLALLWDDPERIPTKMEFAEWEICDDPEHTSTKMELVEWEIQE